MLVAWGRTVRACETDPMELDAMAVGTAPSRRAALAALPRRAGAAGLRTFGTLLRHPARLIATAYAAGTLVGTLLLASPFASESGQWTSWVTALFTATSAICVTGLVVVDTATHWSVFGEVVILGLIQAGGMGIMTLATLIGLVIVRKIRMRLQIVTQAETKSLQAADIRQVITGIVAISVAVEAVTAVVLAVVYLTRYGGSLGESAYFGFFHSVSAFNNAGFGLRSDSLVAFASDPLILVPVMVALVLGGVGFPVLFELGRHLRRDRAAPARRWSLHTKITVLTYAALAVVGCAAVTALEWGNPGTLGGLDLTGKITSGIFQGISPRTAGFNSVDYAQMTPSSLLVTDILMFIGGGTAGTAGGIKVTTFALLAFVIWTEVKGQPSVHVFGRRLGAEVQRQAVTIALLSVAAVMAGTISLLLITGLDLDAVLFESVSAFGTVGLSTGITGGLPAAAQLVLVALMFAGRLGPITLATALALRERTRRYELPEERPLVG